MFARYCLLLFFLLPSLAVAAHITDKLVVGLYPQPGAEGTPLQLLSSGTPLEVLQRKQGFAEVRLADDTQGWVEADYITNEKPAKAMLLETQARLRQMGLELAALRATANDSGAPTPVSLPPSAREAELQRQLDKTQQRVAVLEDQVQSQAIGSDAEQRLEALRAEVRSALEALAATQGLALQAAEPPTAQDAFTRYRPWIIGLVALVLGFAAGIAFVDHRIRKRYGGFRI
jgi:SH3 domain protein